MGIFPTMRRAALGAAAGLLVSGGWAFAEPAGVAAAVVGDVTVAGPSRAKPMAVQSGSELVLDDRLRTARASRAQALLLDETTLTLGPESEVVIDRFVFDPDGGTGEMSARFLKGAMRFVSGRIGRLAPTRVSVRTPVGTLGIRGTMAFIIEDEEAGGIFFGLTGTGRLNDLGARHAGIVFSNENGRQTTHKSGFGFFVPNDGGPGPVRPIPEKYLAILDEQLRTTPTDGEVRAEVDDPDAASGRLIAELFRAGDDLAVASDAAGRRSQFANIFADQNLFAALAAGMNVGSTGGFTNIGVAPGAFEFIVFDHGAIDGDIIDLAFVENGVRQDLGRINLPGRAGAPAFQFNLQPGTFQIEVFAVNEGNFSPNTGTVEIRTPVADGAAIQRYDQNTGDRAILRGIVDAANQVNVGG